MTSPTGYAPSTHNWEDGTGSYGLTLDDALRWAVQVGGTLNWSTEKGWYVTDPQVDYQEPIPTTLFGSSRWPWETGSGEGFMAPWTNQALDKEGKSVAFVKPKISGRAADKLEVAQIDISTLTSPYGESYGSMFGYLPLTPSEQEDIQKELDDLNNPDEPDLSKVTPDPDQSGWETDPSGAWAYISRNSDGEVLDISPSGPPDEDAWISGAEPYIESRGGYDYEVRLDPMTGESFYVLIGPTEEDELPEMPPGMFATYEEAVAAAPENYVPTQTADGWWMLTYKEPDTYKQDQQDLQQQMINWYREQQGAELEAQKQERLAYLRANPASWLEYASLAGETPAIQPWMLPLMPQEYSSLQAEEAIPNWKSDLTTPLSDMPEMTNPSMQYYARMNPSSQQQFQGYKQARTGQTPEDTTWRLWSNAPPSGQNAGLTYTR